MRHTIEQLYYGNLDPAAKTYYREGEYGKATEKAEQAKNALSAMLSEQTKDLLDEVISLYDDVGNLLALDAFTDGFRLGGKLAIEILSDNNDGALREQSE